MLTYQRLVNSHYISNSVSNSSLCDAYWWHNNIILPHMYYVYSVLWYPYSIELILPLMKMNYAPKLCMRNLWRDHVQRQLILARRGWMGVFVTVWVWGSLPVLVHDVILFHCVGWWRQRNSTNLCINPWIHFCMWSTSWARSYSRPPRQGETMLQKLRHVSVTCLDMWASDQLCPRVMYQVATCHLKL